MVLGFNHNIMYKGELFHVQTEDSGRANPHIITLLYRGGTILASAKTSYADIITVDQLETVVESIMKEQHKQMMRRLKAGEFDARIFPSGAPASANQAAAPTADPSPAAGAPAAAEFRPPKAEEPRGVTGPAAAAPQPVPEPRPAGITPSPTIPPAPSTKRSLDEVILDYLITGEEK